ncbi:MAG TPA: 4'-phosphopantetheinyl transferase superfamily protein [Planctomycetota bacterium]|nr:4'-phosphopantetheinyl transferase superfamily protein [Planctomycetota bacterium]
MPRIGREIAGTPLLLVREEDMTAESLRLTPEEERHAASFTHPKRRAEWALGRVAAREALARAAGIDPGGLVVLPDEDGAPRGFHEGRPLALGVSISHGHGRAISWALTEGLPGVDLERVKPRPEGTFRFYLDPEERASLQKLEGEERDRAAVVLWSLKEAVWKTLRPHRGVGLLDFKLGGVDGLAASGGVVATPSRGAVDLARERGIEKIEARFLCEGEIVYAWAVAR